MPHFLVCLAHFCEIHGPSMIFCTQKAAESPLSSTLSSCESCSLQLPQGATSLVTGDQNGQDQRENESLSPRVSQSHQSQSLQSDSSHQNFQNNQNLHPDKEWSYITSRYPHQQRLYTSLSKLVMKVLSVEAVADPSKPVFYGDSTNGYCLSKVFSISDVHARGGERKYAFLVVCDHETALIDNWDFVAVYVSELISILQRKSESQWEEAKAAFANNERYLRRSKNMPRNLVALTGDPDVFVKLHSCAVELLRDVNE